MDVLGLLRIAKGLNAGADLAGNAIGAPTRFAIACAANPAASDLEVEFSKLRAKIEAGATFAQTQPVYDLEALARFLERPEARAIPILVGLIPLLSLKQTLFFANEVPGIVVPPAIQDRMRRAAERGPEHEKAEGLAIARELAAGIAGARPRHPRHADGPVQDGRRGPRVDPAPPSGSPGRRPSRPGIPGARGSFSRAGPDFNRIRTRGGLADAAPPQRRIMKTTMMRLTGGLAALLGAGHLYAGAQCRAVGAVTDSTGAPLEDVTITVTTPNLTSFNLDDQDRRQGQLREHPAGLHDALPLQVREGGLSPLRASTRRFRSPSIGTIDAKLMSKTEAQAKAAAAAAPQIVGQRPGRHRLQRRRRGDATRATRPPPRRSSRRPSRRTRTCPPAGRRSRRSPTTRRTGPRRSSTGRRRRTSIRR